MTEGIIVAIIVAIGGLAGNVLTGIFDLIKTRIEVNASQVQPTDTSGTQSTNAQKAQSKSKWGILAAFIALILCAVPGAVVFRQYLSVKSTLPVYAILYDDGSLVFQHGNQPDITRLWKGRKETYQVDMENDYRFVDGQPTTPWYSEREFVQEVVFTDVIQPKSTAYWFHGFRNMKSVRGISRLETGNVTSMYAMFYNCNSLEKLDVSRFDTANVTNMGYMFAAYEADNKFAKLDVSGFNTAKVTNMASMFQRCVNLETLDLSGFDTANVTDMSRMFSSCKELATIYVSNQFVTSQVEESASMFFDCLKLKGMETSNDATYIDKTYARIDGGPSSPGYFSAKD